MNGLVAYTLAKKYTEDTVIGEGAIIGKDGKSAYEIAVDNGFAGTESEWLESLKGEDGANTLKAGEGLVMSDDELSVDFSTILNNEDIINAIIDSGMEDLTDEEIQEAYTK